MTQLYQKYGFKISVQQLQSFFDISNINNGDSFKKLKEFGGSVRIAQALKTDLYRGLSNYSEVEIVERQEIYGQNKPIIKQRKGFLKIVLQNFKQPILQVLLAATIISLVLGIYNQGWKQGWLQGVSIFIAVLIIVVVTSVNNYIKQIQFEKLNAQVIKKNINIRRNNYIINISVYDVLVGDIAYVQTGEILSADGILIEGNHLVVDQSSITGQSKEIKKLPENQVSKAISPFLLSGSKIIEGSGTMLILAVGKNSIYGKIRSMILQADEQQQTPLQQKLESTVIILGKIGIAFGIMIFLVMVIHFLIDCSSTPSFKTCVISMNALNQLITAIIIAITIFVIAIPEGLPLAVTITLAYSGQRMKEQHNLVRYLAATQIMGGVNNICSDKTGTITKNIMSVQKIMLQENLYNIYQRIERYIINPHYFKIFLNSICQNTNAHPIIEADGTFTAVGNKTECALIELVKKMGYNYKQIRNPQRKLKTFQFSSKTKKMSTIYRQIDSQYIFSKGAPEILLKNCTRFVNSDGLIQKINPRFINSFNTIISNFTQQSLRTLLLAYKPLFTNNFISNNAQDYQNDLIILTLVGIKDPLKQGVADTIKYCKDSGITVRMVTGDNRQTAISIAKQAGLLQKDYVYSKTDYSVMEGNQFRSFVGGILNIGTEQQTIGDIHNFSLVADQLVVLARSSPQDKYILTCGLKQLGNVVAVTGDGTNDAPALKKADIGFSMNSGTEVAKQASGIVLQDNNFNSIQTAIKVGRNVFKNVRKFIQFQLTINFVALLVCFYGSIALKQSPLTTVQMLWLNLVMDTLASLALATEPPIQSEIEPKPYTRYENIVTSQMLINIIFQVVYQIIILSIIMFLGPQIFNVPNSLMLKKKYWTVAQGKHSSIFFSVFMYLQIFNFLNARKIKIREYNVFKNICNNWMFWTIIIMSIIIQIVITQFGGKALKCAPLNITEHLICISIGFSCVPFAFLYKLILPNQIQLSWEGIQCGGCYWFWKKKSEQIQQKK